MPVLTDIESRAAIKGSCGLLGAQAICTLLSRYVAGGLTTNTTSVRDFVALHLGHRFIEKLDEAASPQEAQPVLIGWERLAPYSDFDRARPVPAGRRLLKALAPRCRGRGRW